MQIVRSQCPSKPVIKPTELRNQMTKLTLYFFNNYCTLNNGLQFVHSSLYSFRKTINYCPKLFLIQNDFMTASSNPNCVRFRIQSDINVQSMLATSIRPSS